MIPNLQRKEWSFLPKISRKESCTRKTVLRLQPLTLITARSSRRSDTASIMQGGPWCYQETRAFLKISSGLPREPTCWFTKLLLRIYSGPLASHNRNEQRRLLNIIRPQNNLEKSSHV